MKPERISKLEAALELSKSLRLLLADTGPRQYGGEAGNGAFQVAGLELALDVQLQDIARQRNELLTPIYRLPDDVLSYIFCVPASHDWAPSSYFSEAVSAVSRRWRNVALDSPRMWAAIIVGDAVQESAVNKSLHRPGFGRNSQVKQSTRRQDTRTWVERARMAPLTLEITPRHLNDDFSSILDLLSQRIPDGLSSINRLYCHLADAEEAETLKDLVSLCHDTLETLSITQDSDASYEPEFTHSMDDIFGMTMGAVKEIVLLAPVPSQFIGFASCEKLSMHCDARDMMNLPQLLRSCSNLKQLSATFFRIQHHEGEEVTIHLHDDEHVHMPRLESLSIDEPDPCVFLSLIRAPNLHFLRLKRIYPWTATDTLQAFLIVSSQRLTSLDFLAHSPPSLGELLSILPSLALAGLGNEADSVDAITSINAAQSAAEPTCPKLQTLRIRQLRNTGGIYDDVESAKALAEHTSKFLQLRKNRPDVSDIGVLDIERRNRNGRLFMKSYSMAKGIKTERGIQKLLRPW